MQSSVTRIDPHVKVLNDAVVRRAKARGMDAIVYAPHFVRLPEIQSRAAAYSDAELTVIPGRELFTGSWRNRRHILAIGLETPVPDFITLQGAFSACKRQDASVLVPHPGFMTVSLTAAEVRANAAEIDAIERYNPKFLPVHTRQARALVDSLDIPVFGSSYAHFNGTVGEVWTEVAGRIDSAASLQRALADGAIRGIDRRRGWQHHMRRVAECSHLLWENSWKKFDRVVLHDCEATHPTHTAYDGRFDTVSVY